MPVNYISDEEVASRLTVKEAKNYLNDNGFRGFNYKSFVAMPNEVKIVFINDDHILNCHILDHSRLYSYKLSIMKLIVDNIKEEHFIDHYFLKFANIDKYEIIKYIFDNKIDLGLALSSLSFITFLPSLNKKYINDCSKYYTSKNELFLLKFIIESKNNSYILLRFDKLETTTLKNMFDNCPDIINKLGERYNIDLFNDVIVNDHNRPILLNKLKFFVNLYKEKEIKDRIDVEKLLAHCCENKFGINSIKYIIKEFNIESLSDYNVNVIDIYVSRKKKKAKPEYVTYLLDKGCNKPEVNNNNYYSNELKELIISY